MTMSSSRAYSRADVLAGHFAPVDGREAAAAPEPQPVAGTQSKSLTPTAMLDKWRQKASFEVGFMRDYIGAERAEHEAFVYEQLADCSRDVFGLSMAEHRAKVNTELLKLARAGCFPLRKVMRDPSLNKIILMRLGAVFAHDMSLGVKCAVNFGLFSSSVLRLGTERHHAMVDDLESGNLLGCFAMTEIGHGSNVRALRTTITYDRDTKEFVINTPDRMAVKWWIGNALTGTAGTVLGRLILDGEDLGIHAIFVPLRDPKSHDLLPGVTIGDCGHKVGLHGVDNGFIAFSNVRVPRENLLDHFGGVGEDGTYSSPIANPDKRFAAMLGELVGGRVFISLTQAVHLRYALTVAIRFAASRVQFGPRAEEPEVSILHYQTQQRRLMPILATTYALDFASRYLMDRFVHMDYDDPSDVAFVHSLASGLKAVSSWYCHESLSICREACGGHGFSAYARFGKMRDDNDVSQTYEGDNTVLMQQTAKDLLVQYRREFSRGQFSGMLRFISRNMLTLVKERNPIITRFQHESHLRSTEFLQHALDYRAARLVHISAMSLRRNRGHPDGMFGAWNESLAFLIDLARAHVERVILEKFIHAVDRCRNLGTADVLKRMCELYALSCIERDLGFFLQHRYIRPNKARAIRALVTQLSSELADEAVGLVDAFNFPEHIMDSPFGAHDGNYVDRVLEYVSRHQHDPRTSEDPVGQLPSILRSGE